MHDRWSEFASELESSDSERVNDVLDEIGDMDLGERIELFDECFEKLTRMYDATDDGYVRQSVVRVAEQLVPGIPTVFAVDNDERSIGVDETDVREQTDALCGFLLEAIIDDDGRVRQSAQRGLKDVFRTYDTLDDEETLEGLVAELDEMAAQAPDTQEKHLREAKANARFTLKSGIARLVDGLQDEFEESPDSGP